MRKNHGLARLAPILICLLAIPLLGGCDEHHHLNPVSPNDDEYVEYEELTQNAANVALVGVRTVNGGIRIESGTVDRLWVRVRKEVRARNATEAKRIAGLIELKVYREADEIRVTSDLPHVDEDVQIEISYEIECPSGVELELFAVNGEIRITGSPSQIRTEAGNGRITTTLDEFRGTGVFKVGNGEVRAQIARGNPSLEVRLANGVVKLGLQPDYSGSLELHTATGSVKCDLPLTWVIHQSSNRIAGVLGDGGPAYIDVRSANGLVHVAGN